MATRKDDCIFCKIANGDIPSNSIYEDDDFKVFLDLSPANKGHALIVPKVHYDNAYEMDDEFAAKVFPLATKVARAVKKALNADGVNILQNNEEVAGQTVFHFHMHVIPRFKDDTVNVSWVQNESNPEEQAKLAEILKAEMK
ncbi:MAG: HIT family protein [Lachnospiraceae bacterium]|nr:HIT family protein [Lachnospiraceae bacterium]